MARLTSAILAIILLLPNLSAGQGRRNGVVVRGVPAGRNAPVVVRNAPVVVRNAPVIVRNNPAMRIAVQPNPVQPFARAPVAPFVNPPVGTPAFPSVQAGSSPFFNPLFSGVRQRRAIVSTQPFGIYSPFFWSGPVAVDPYYNSVNPYYNSVDPFYNSVDPYYNSVDPYNAQPYPPPAVSPQESDLSYEVGRLSEEVAQLREQQALSQPPRPVAPAAPEAPAVPTALIFRDGHRTEIHNYAIVGETLWVLDDNNSSKINLADLDIDATQSVNRARGVRFLLRGR